MPFAALKNQGVADAELQNKKGSDTLTEQLLQDKMCLENAKKILNRVQTRQIHTEHPNP